MIVLIGFMGAGKTTVGRILAARLGLPFVDTDQLVSDRAGLSIRQIFATQGEPAFRELERAVVQETLGGPDSVVALGGGALGDPAIATALQGTSIVHLGVSWGETRRRLKGDESRPLLQAGDPKALFDRRQDMYEMVAKHRVDTDGRRPEEIANEIALSVGGSRIADEQMQRVVVPLGARSYDVVIGRDLLGRLGDLIPRAMEAEKAFVIGHASLERFTKEATGSLEAGGVRTVRLDVPEGETSKSLEMVEQLWRRLAEEQARRHDLVISLGGGVICDLAGFVASTFNRGMPLAHIPTTLLAQVDAAIGGKCGINLSEGKNLIGAIYQPSVVLCDIDLLASVPQEELRSGMAEVVKYGLIADPEMLDGIEDRAKKIYDGDARALVGVVSRSASVKASFVASDERDEGRRAFLNYGHTFAHAIERIGGFGAVRHGEAVSLGMMAAACLSQGLGRLSEYGVQVHRRVLEGVGLPVTADLSLEAMEAAWQHDKKYKNGVRFVLLDDIGRPQSGIQADRGDIGAALGRMRG